jgi:hypothetical protein
MYCLSVLWVVLCYSYTSVCVFGICQSAHKAEAECGKTPVAPRKDKTSHSPAAIRNFEIRPSKFAKIEAFDECDEEVTV